MSQSSWREKAAYVLIGAAAAAAIMLLVGAALPDISEIGRYRMCCSRRGQFTEIFVIDTTNGVVKWYGSGNENKPFQEIK